MSKFYSAYRTDDEYFKAQYIAYQKYHNNEPPNWSQGICGSVTAGYGKLDEYGYWEFPLNVVMFKGKPFIDKERGEE